jgi:REP element-mobilizing transposase RayT
MARPLRIEYAGAFYHVMNRGAARNPVFLDPMEDRSMFLRVLDDAVRLWKIRVHAYSLMTNHYHLLLETPLPNLSRAMRHIDGIYTQRLNRRHRRDGPLFRGRFKSILVERESYFLELVRYIHLNGVKALLYRNAERDPNCSHASYLGLAEQPGWLTTDLALSFFGENPVRARKALQRFVADGVPKELETILTSKRWPAVLGAVDFIQLIKQRFGIGHPPHKEKPQERLIAAIALMRPEQILKSVAAIFGLTLHQIERPNRRATVARNVAVYFLRHRCHLPYRAIGMLMGIGDSGVHRCLKMAQAMDASTLSEMERRL